jgi:hypothetical protein
MLATFFDEVDEVARLTHQLAEHRDELLWEAAHVLTGPNLSTEHAQGAHDAAAHMGNVIRLMRTSRPSVLFRLIDDQIARFSDLQPRFPEHVQLEVDGLIEALQAFHGAYETLVSSYDTASAMAVLAAGGDVEDARTTLIPVLITIEEGFGEEGVIAPGESLFELYLASHSDFARITRQFEAIVELYDTLCNVMDVAPGEHPLRVAHFASGSLWLKLFGESRVITLMVSLVQRSVNYLHRNFTNEGKISSIPRKLEALDAAVRFTNGLADAGIDPGPMRAELQHSSVLIANELNALLAGEPSVRLNGTEIALATELHAGYLEAGRKMLPARSQDSLTEPGEMTPEQP